MFYNEDSLNLSFMNINFNRWADEKEAAEYLKVKPATLRRR